MVLVGEVEEPVVGGAVRGGRPPGLRQQVRPQAQPLADRHAVVLVAVDDEHRGDDLAHEPVRRVLLLHLLVHLAGPVERGVRRRAEAVQRPQRGVRDHAPEPVGVPGHPVRHVAAERAAHGGGAVAVDVLTRHDGVRERHQVRVGRLAPAAPAAFDEVLAVARGQRRVRQQHRVAARRHDPRGPAPAPRVPRAQRPAVDPQQQRVAAGRRLPLGEHEPAAHARAVLGDGLHVLEGARDRGALHGVRQARGLARGQVDPRHLRREQVGGADAVGRGPVRGEHDVGPRLVLPGHLRDGAGGHLDAEHRAATLGVRERDHRGVVRQPRDDVGPAVPAVGQGRGLARGRVHHVQARVHGGVRGGVGGADDDGARAVMADGADGDVLAGDVVQDAVLARGQVHAHHRALAHVAAGLGGGGRGEQERAVRGHLRADPERVGARESGDVAQVVRHVVGLGSQAGGGGAGLGGVGVRGGLALRVRAGLEDEELGAGGAEVVVPEADGVAGVQDGVHTGVLAGLREGRVLGLGGGAEQPVRRDDDAVRRGGARDRGDAARAGEHHARLAAPGRQGPQGAALLGLGVGGVGTGGGEEEGAVRGELRAGLALAGAGQAVGGALARGVDLPEGGGVAGALRVPGGDGGHQAGAVRAEGETGDARQGGEGVEVVEGGGGGVVRGVRGGGHAFVSIGPHVIRATRRTAGWRP